MAWLICVHHAGSLGMPTSNKQKNESFGAFSDCNAAFKFFTFSSASIRRNVLPSLHVTLITLFYFHSAGKHYKNMSFTVHMVTSATHETCAQGCNHVQHIQVASSNLLSELWHLALKFVLLCLQKSENPKKTFQPFQSHQLPSFQRRNDPLHRK